MIDYNAEVERILDGPPSTLAFRALCAALGRAGNPQDLVSLCDERLGSWPDATRAAPWSWLAALDAGYTKPAWSLVRSLDLKPAHDGLLDPVLPDHDRIEKLTLADLVATDVTAEAFVAAQAFPRLRHLDLSCNRLGATGARQLAADVRMPALEYLDLSGGEGGSPYYGRPAVQPIGDAGAEAWASSPNAAKLTYLNVSATGLGVRGLTALMNSERLRLDTLDLSTNPVGSWPAELGNAPLWSTVETLNVTECGDDDIEALVATTSAPCLRSISLAYNSVGSQGGRALASWPVLSQLWELNLHDNVIGDDGLAELARSKAAQRLLELDLEQDCWNSSAGRHGTRLPVEAIGQAFPSLDAIFLGIVDEYHSARYSSGFPAQVRQDIASARATRPELVAFLTHLQMTEEDAEVPDDPRWESERASRDFRTDRAASHSALIEEAKDFARRMIAGDIGWPPPES